MCPTVPGMQSRDRGPARRRRLALAGVGVDGARSAPPAPGDAGCRPRRSRSPHTLWPRERRLARERAAAAAAAGSIAGAAPARRLGRAGGSDPRPGAIAALIAAKVLESWTTMPHFSVTREVDAARHGGGARRDYDAAAGPASPT